jgi:hypothetical protein
LRRNLLFLDLLLLALCAVGVWRMTEFRKERLAEQTSFLKRKEVPVPAPVVLMPPKPTPVTAGPYLEVAQKLLLSADRNPSVILDVVPPKVMPPLPRAYGAMDFGDGPRVVLAAAHGAAQRSYAPGETIGEFKLLTITQAGLVFEWDGQQVAALFEQLRDTAPVVAARAGAGKAAPAKSSSAVASSSGQNVAAKSGGANGSGVQTIASSSEGQGKPGAGKGWARSCAAGDTAPAGTVTDGYRKVVQDLGFFKNCYWEKVQ